MLSIARLILVLWLAAGLIMAANSEVLGYGAEENADTSLTPQDSAIQKLDELKALMDSRKYEGVLAQVRDILAEVEARYGAESLETARVIDVLVQAVLGSEEYIHRREFIDRNRHAKTREEKNSLRQQRRDSLTQARNESRGLAKQARAVRERLLGAFHPETAKSWNGFVFQALEWGGLSRAERKSLLDEALSLSEKTLGPDHAEVAKILYQLGRYYYYGKNVKEAIETLGRALRINENTYGPDHLSVAQVIDEYALSLFDTGRQTEALALQERAVRIRENDPDTEYGDYHWSVTILSTFFLKMGLNERAIVLLERTLPLKEKLLSPTDPAIFGELHQLGFEYMRIRDFTKAREYYQRSLEKAEEIYGRNDSRLDSVLNSLANIYRYTGEYEKARSLYERCLAFGNNVIVLGNLAILYRLMGDDVQEKACRNRIVETYEKNWGTELPESPIYNLMDYARQCVRLGEFHKALGIQEHVLSVLEKKSQQDRQLVRCLIELASNYRNLGESARAREYVARALAAIEKSGSPDSLDNLNSFTMAALHLVCDGRSDEAFKVANRVEEIRRRNLGNFVFSFPESVALRYDPVHPNCLDICLSLAYGDTEARYDFVDKKWDALIKSRALVFDELAYRNQILVDAARPELSDLSRSFIEARQRLANLVVRGPGQIENYSDVLKKAMADKNNAERSLAEASFRFKEKLERNNAGMNEIRASLPSGYSLVSLVKYNRIIPFSLEEEPERDAAIPPLVRELVPSYLAFVLRSQEDDPVLIPFGRAEDIESLVFDWYQEAIRGTRIPGRSSANAESAYRSAGDALRRKVWDPLVPYLGESRRVLIVPDGSFNKIDFSTLPVGKEEFLIDSGFRFQYLSAERDLLPSNNQSVQAEGLLALGGAEYDDTSLFRALSPGAISEPDSSQESQSPSHFRGLRSGCEDFKSLKFNELPASGDEIYEIADVWKRSGENPADLSMLVGPAANEESFKTAAAGKRFIHLATHGFFIEENCPSILSPQQGRQDFWEIDQIPVVTGENPLLLSGLALAGANHRTAAGPDEEDGILTAEEIATLDLRGARLVVLSACKSGLGKIKSTEGIFGLRRAFLLAGAQTLISSLWAVDDEISRKWMEIFYRALFIDGFDISESAHKAGVTLLEEQRRKGQSSHPFYWAGFIVSGKWR